MNEPKISRCGCGGIASVTDAGPLFDHQSYVVCGKCGTRTPLQISPARAIHVWNNAVRRSSAGINCEKCRYFTPNRDKDGVRHSDWGGDGYCKYIDAVRQWWDFCSRGRLITDDKDEPGVLGMEEG